MPRPSGALAGTHCSQPFGDIARARNDPDRAEVRYQDSFYTCRTVAPNSTASAHCVEGLAAVATMRGQDVAAARLYGAASPARDVIGASQRPSVRIAHDRIIADVRRRLGTERFLTAWNTGQALSLDEAVEMGYGYGYGSIRFQ